MLASKPPFSSRRTPFYRLGVSKYLSRLGRHYESIAVLKEGIKDKPKYADYYVSLGVEYRQVIKYPEAIEAFQTAVKLDPKNAWAHLLLGLIYERRKDKEAALREYDILKKLDAAMAEDLREAIQKTSPAP